MALYQYRVRFSIFVRMETLEKSHLKLSWPAFFCLICMQLTKLSLIDILYVKANYLVDGFAGKTIHSEVGSFFVLTL